jgi:hypothetical protein
MYGFKNDLTSELRCEFALQPRNQDKVIYAADPELCHNVAAGNVKVLNDEDSDDDEVDEEVFGSTKDKASYGGEPSYSLSQATTVDLYNDGKPLRVAIATRTIESGAGCGHEYQDAWPVVVKADGKPDLSYRAIDSIGQGVRIIGFHGQTYLDSQITDDEGELPSDEDPEYGPEIHEIGRLSQGGYAKMCTLQSRVYAIKP